MPDYLLLGVDIAPQGAKFVLCDTAGHIVASGYQEHSTTSPNPGWAEHDAEQLWWGALIDLVDDVLGESSTDAKRLAPVGVSAFVPGMLPLGADGGPLRSAILDTDRRAEAELTVEAYAAVRASLM